MILCGPTDIEIQALTNFSLSMFALIVDVFFMLLQDVSGSVPNVDVSLQMMPKPDYTPDLTYLQTISSIYFVLAYSFFINFLTVNLVAEKEKKIREGMFMMGLRNSIFW